MESFISRLLVDVFGAVLFCLPHPRFKRTQHHSSHMSQQKKDPNIRTSLSILTPARLSGSQCSQRKNPPRLVIDKLVLENFKSYAGNLFKTIL
jgi:hypothetical protein